MLPPLHHDCSECIEVDHPIAGEATLPCMADPALWWSYRRRLFIPDPYRKAKSQQYFEFFGDKLLSTVCIAYLKSLGLPFAMVNALHLLVTSNANWKRWSSSIPFIQHFVNPSDAFEVPASLSISPPLADSSQVLSSSSISAPSCILTSHHSLIPL